MNLSECPDKSTLHALATGALPEDSRVGVSRHVDTCARCRATVDAFDASHLATIVPDDDEVTEIPVPESPRLLRFVPDENRSRLSQEMRAVADDFASALQHGQEADIEAVLAGLGLSADSLEFSAEQMLLLLELIDVELRQAWSKDIGTSAEDSATHGEPEHAAAGRFTTDQYVQRFPVLRSCPLLVADLAKREAGLRGYASAEDRHEESGHPTGIEQFDLIEPIASGGMGVVWKARNRELGRTVAVKLIKQDKTVGNPERQQLYQQRFLVEAQAAARLTHPNIVPIHSIHNSAGELYYEMDLIEGGSLRGLVSGGAMVGVRQAVETMQAVASAVDHAHRRGVIHRDLKPENILMKDGKIPMVTDFGLAKLVDSDTALTQDDTAMGTMNYMAPEQFRDAASVTVSADIYSMGSMLYELLAGHVPFAYSGDISSFSEKVQHADPPAPQRIDRTVSRDIQNVCLKCLAKQPHQRYGSAAELEKDLQAYLEGRAVSARRIGPLGHFWRLCRRYPRTASLAGALVLALVVGFGVSVKFMLDARQQAQLAQEAVSHFYLQIDQNDAFRQPAFNDLRGRLMNEGRERLSQLTYAPVSSRTRSNQRAIATLHFVNGRSLQESFQPGEALAEFLRAESIQRRLSQDDANDLDSLADLATTLNAMDEVSPPDAVAHPWLEEAQSIRGQVAEKLSNDDPRKPKALRLLANVLMNKANRLAEPIIERQAAPTAETVNEAVRLFREASEKRQEAAILAAKVAVDPGEQDALARDTIVGKANLAVLLSQVQGKSPEAFAAIQDAATALAEYLTSHPWDVEARRQFAECQLSKYLMADIKTDAEFTAIDEAERDADIVVAMTPKDMRSHRTVARIAIERALELIVTDLDVAMESNAEQFAPAGLNAAAVEYLDRAFEHLPAESTLVQEPAETAEVEFLTVVRLTRALRALTPLPPESYDAAPEELRADYLQRIRTAKEHLYQPPADAAPLTSDDFLESRIWILAYSSVVAQLQFDTLVSVRKAEECLAAIQQRRQLGHDDQQLSQCEALVKQVLRIQQPEEPPSDDGQP